MASRSRSAPAETTTGNRTASGVVIHERPPEPADDIRPHRLRHERIWEGHESCSTRGLTRDQPVPLARHWRPSATPTSTARRSATRPGSRPSGPRLGRPEGGAPPGVVCAAGRACSSRGRIRAAARSHIPPANRHLGGRLRRTRDEDHGRDRTVRGRTAAAAAHRRRRPRRPHGGGGRRAAVVAAPARHRRGR